MPKIKFYSKYNPGPVKFEVNCGETIVDAAGYISPKQRITNIIRAGERLEELRREMYDYDSDDEDDGYTIDPLRKPGLDLSEVSQLQNLALSRLRERAANKKKPADSEGTKAEQPAIVKEQAAHSDKDIKPDGA